MTLIQLFKKYSLIIIGGSIFTMYFWNRFIRERTSKFLPLDLNTLGLISLIYICIIFLYITISLLKPRNKNVILEQAIEWLFTPIMAFDNYLKEISFIQAYYKNIVLCYLIPLLEFLIIRTNLFFIVTWLFPRLIMLIALFVDIFGFHQLHYKYQVILFGLLLFLNRYLRYSLKNFKAAFQANLETNVSHIYTNYFPGVHPAELAEDYDPNDPDEQEYDPNMELPFNIFVTFQTESIVYRGVINEIKSCRVTDHFINEMKKCLSNPIFGSIEYMNLYDRETILIKAQIQLLVKLSVILETYSLIDFNPHIKWLKALIFFNYFLCWLYILIVSIKTLDIWVFNIMLENTWINLSNPFSDTK